MNDAGPSLQGALQVLNSYSVVMGLNVNWAKSLLFRIDPGACATASPNMQLQWVDELKYLEVVISHQATDFLSLNLIPVLQEVRVKFKAWETLAFFLIGSYKSD